MKRARRDLSSLAVLTLAPETLAQRLLVMGMVPLVSNLRGFEGLETPRGRWLRLLGWPAYRPSTLHKTLSELAVLGADKALWHENGEQWAVKAQEWSANGPHWKPRVRYLDITTEPHWTDKFARSGKVSENGRIMPSLQRVTLTVNPGVVLKMGTFAGTQSLRKHLRDMLAIEEPDAKEAEARQGQLQGAKTSTPYAGGLVTDELQKADAKQKRARGKQAAEKKPEPPKQKRPDASVEGSERFWITVVDAECAQAGLLWQLCELPNHAFITVLKGNTLKGAKVLETGPWMSYRERDQVREVQLTLCGKGAPAGGMMLRGVSLTPTPTGLSMPLSRKTESHVSPPFERASRTPSSST